MGNFFFTAFVTFCISFIAFPILIGLISMLLGFVVVQERQCRVYILFGKVVGEISEPGLHSLFGLLGPKAFLVNWVGQCQIVDLRLDQQYVRSQPVNSEEGAPMGIGVWYEMFVSDPVNYLFKNSDPRGSLSANVSNATVRCLSNLKLPVMLENRHEMSRTVRAEVSPQSHEWGYRLGSIYVRKVHFRDAGMIKQIEEKVVNRLRQVTGSIRQDGANQVSLITSTADRKASIEFARAAAVRPEVVGQALYKINEDPDIAAVLFKILETQAILESSAQITIIPEGRGEMTQFLAARQSDQNVKPRANPLVIPGETRPKPLA